MVVGLAGAAGIGSVLGWWSGGLVSAGASTRTLARAAGLAVAAAITVSADGLAYGGWGAAVAGPAALACALVVRLAFTAGLRARSGPGGEG